MALLLQSPGKKGAILIEFWQVSVDCPALLLRSIGKTIQGKIGHQWGRLSLSAAANGSSVNGGIYTRMKASCTLAGRWCTRKAQQNELLNNESHRREGSQLASKLAISQLAALSLSLPSSPSFCF